MTDHSSNSTDALGRPVRPRRMQEASAARIGDLLAAGPTLSLEFFPPASDAAVRGLEKTLGALAGDVDPDFVSITYGAGGSTRERTRDLVVDITTANPFPAMPHLTCVGHTRAEILTLLDDYAASGVRNVLALAGDAPVDGSGVDGDFRYAIELVELVREHTDFSIGVAAHPEVHPRSIDRATDRRHLATKLAAADFGITQFFFDPTHYLQMVDELASLGVDTPVMPGVVSVTNPATIRRFAGMNAAAVPEELFARLEAAEGDDRLKIAVEATVKLCGELLDAGAPGLHFYTLNQPEATAAAYAALQ